MATNRPQSRNLSGFTNLQRILDANRQNKLGQTISSGVVKAGEAARAGLSAASQKFQQGAEQERQRQAGQEARVGQVLDNLGNVSDEDVKAFESIRSGQFLGPENLENVGELRGQAESAEGLGRAAGTEAGRMGLLQRFAGGNQKYTSGQQRLDSLLLGQQGGTLKGARRAVAGLGAEAAAKPYAAQQVAQELQSRAKGLGQQTIKRLEEKTTGYDTEMAGKADAANLARKEYIDQVKADLAQDMASEDVLSRLGLKEGEQLWRTNLQDMVKEDEKTRADRYTIQQAQDFARVKALNRLLGTSAQGDPSAILSRYLGRESMVGQYDPASALLRNQEDIRGALDAEKAAYGQLADPTISNIAKLQNEALQGSTLNAILRSGYLTPDNLQQQLGSAVTNNFRDSKMDPIALRTAADQQLVRFGEIYKDLYENREDPDKRTDALERAIKLAERDTPLINQFLETWAGGRLSPGTGGHQGYANIFDNIRANKAILDSVKNSMRFNRTLRKKQ